MTMNMSLDDIIKANREMRQDKKAGNSTKRTQKSSRFGNGKKHNNFAFSAEVPAGQWKHDKFTEEDSDVKSPKVSGGNLNAKVTINISNLDTEKIQATDLEDLFADEEIDSAVVHFDSYGNSLGTGAIVCTRAVAKKILASYSNISLDGRPLKMVIIDEPRSSGIKDRLGFAQSGGLSGRITKPGRGNLAKRESRHPLDRVESDSEDRGRGRFNNRNRGGRQGNRTGKRVEKTTEELDAELEKYMNNGKMQF